MYHIFTKKKTFQIFDTLTTKFIIEEPSTWGSA